MATLDYHKIWKWIEIDWSTFYTFYWQDFNPNVPSIPAFTSAWASQETSNFNLVWFQPWHEVWCLVLVFNMDVSWSLYIESEFQAYIWGWQTTWSGSRTYSVTTTQYMTYIYFWVDDDEIRDYSSQYRIVVNREFSDWTWENWIKTDFTVSNLSIDSDFHTSWYLWVEWENLCYTDWVHHDLWYKHKIQRDSYNWGSWTPWHIRIPNSSTQKRIYYVDAYWTVRRTHVASDRYGGWWYVWSSYAGSIRVPTGDMEYWYWYLCYVDSWGYKRRLGNWEP